MLNKPLCIQIQIMIMVWVMATCSSALFSYFLYDIQKSEYLNGINNKLYSSALMAREITGLNYHDSIRDKNSVSDDNYLRIVAIYNRICRESGLQFIWSNLILPDNSIRFTSATSISKNINNNINNNNHARARSL